MPACVCSPHAAQRAQHASSLKQSTQNAMLMTMVRSTVQADPILNENVRLTVAVVSIDWKSVGFGSAVTSVESVAVAVEGAIAAAAEHITVKKSPSGQYPSVPCTPVHCMTTGAPATLHPHQPAMQMKAQRRPCTPCACCS